MKVEGAAVLQTLVGNDSLLDAVLTRIEIQGGDYVSVTMVFQARHTSRYGQVVLVLRDVDECAFYHRRDFIFLNVEHLKFLMTDDGAFYISLAPYDEAVREPVEQDECFVKARAIEAVLTSR